jgi:hypothetical protein
MAAPIVHVAALVSVMVALIDNLAAPIVDLAVPTIHLAALSIVHSATQAWILQRQKCILLHRDYTKRAPCCTKAAPKVHLLHQTCALLLNHASCCTKAALSVHLAAPNVHLAAPRISWCAFNCDACALDMQALMHASNSAHSSPQRARAIL